MLASGIVIPTKKSYMGVSHLKRNAETNFTSDMTFVI